MDTPKTHPPLTVYTMLLHLSPASFRRQFAAQMLETFADLLHDRGPFLAVLLIVREFIPTLIREHFDDRSSFWYLIRFLICLLPPLAIYAFALRNAHSFDEYFLSTSWALSILASLCLTRCRGRRCLLHAAL